MWKRFRLKDLNLNKDIIYITVYQINIFYLKKLFLNALTLDFFFILHMMRKISIKKKDVVKHSIHLIQLIYNPGLKLIR